VSTRVGLFLLMVPLAGCGADSPTSPGLETETFAVTLSDPDRCACQGGVAEYAIEVQGRGVMDVVVRLTAAEAAQVDVRVSGKGLESVAGVGTWNVVATSSQSYAVEAGTYRVHLSLAPTARARTAAVGLTVIHP